MRWRNLLVLISLISLFGCTSSPQNVHSPESSRTVNVDGYCLRLLSITGKGTPTVVLESGLGAGVESWTKVQPSVSQVHLIVAYDHPGIGGSECWPETANWVSDRNRIKRSFKKCRLDSCLMRWSGTPLAVPIFMFSQACIPMKSPAWCLWTLPKNA